MNVTLRHLYSGKVRDLYEVDEAHLLMVASDRLSAYDVVMHEPIPDKGRVLTGLTDFWLGAFASSVGSSLVSCDPAVIASRVATFADEPSWEGRAMLVRRATMLPLECIVRGRLAGQAYEEYAARGTVHGAKMAPGLRLTDPFDAPIFTPSTKADEGHDRNIDLAEAAQIVGSAVLEEAQAMCLDLFTRAAARLAEVGIILADTKFELGFVDGALVFCDEVLTPDSSRLWPTDAVRAGETPPSFDKQPFRDWLDAQHWSRTPPPPRLPEDVVEVTRARYVEAYERVTGRSLRDWYGA
ncbi:MAG: phosphoribosylaminoimidazolesuccinocarboxamide synthase [Acidobacteriota bacterium]|nr:phosphoribosylaminoimidazolesuccinocarboxamide synthase [Acidobacteriota bacterium]